MEETTPTLTNREVATALDLSESGVSRLRSGTRLPSLPLMQRIEAAYGWSVQGQSNSRAIDQWSKDFELVLADKALDLGRAQA